MREAESDSANNLSRNATHQGLFPVSQRTPLRPHHHDTLRPHLRRRHRLGPRASEPCDGAALRERHRPPFVSTRRGENILRSPEEEPAKKRKKQEKSLEYPRGGSQVYGLLDLCGDARGSGIGPFAVGPNVLLPGFCACVREREERKGARVDPFERVGCCCCCFTIIKKSKSSSNRLGTPFQH